MPIGDTASLPLPDPWVNRLEEAAKLLKMPLRQLLQIVLEETEGHARIIRTAIARIDAPEVEMEGTNP